MRRESVEIRGVTRGATRGTSAASRCCVLRQTAYLLAFGLVACSRPVPHTAATPVPVTTTKPVVTALETSRVGAIAINDSDSVDLTPDGTLLDTAKAMRIAVGGRVFTLAKTSDESKIACHIDYDSGPFDYDGHYHGEGLALVDDRGQATTLVEKAEKSDDDRTGIADEDQRATLVGVVGPYLFVRETHHFFGCGAAHPMTNVSSFVYDVENKTKIELTPSKSVVDEAVKGFMARSSVETDFDESAPNLAEAIPRFDEAGRLSLAWRFEKGTAYAFGDGAGSDYTASVVVEAKELPVELQPFREPPAAIRNYLANGGEPITGWSRVN